MVRKAVVTSVSGADIQVLPLIKGGCASCASSCDKRGSPFSVTNPGGYPVAVGNVVTLVAPRAAQAVQGIVSLLVPFLCAVGGYFAAVPIAAAAGRPAGDGLRAACVLGCLAVASVLVLVVTRRFPLPGKPEITEVHQG